MIAGFVFGATIVLEILLCGGLVVSLLYPKNRVWPFPKKNSWQYWYIQILTKSSFFLFFALGFLDWNTFFLSNWSRWVFGFILIIIGAIIFLWALRTYRTTFSTAFLEEIIEIAEKPINDKVGLKGKLVTDGPYRYSRNPQYLANILFFSGIMLLFNSSYQFAAGILGILCFLLAAFAEESFLKDRFKDDYDAYCKEVPRFI
jgi:protein-S-isoprenylcysteine O-methyltransferase Ste14